MSLLAELVIAALIFVGGVATGIRWHAGQDAIAAQAAEHERQQDQREQRRFNDHAAGNHAAELAAINLKLGDARAQIAKLSDRPCLSHGTVSLLNAIGEQPVRAPAGEPAGAAQAAAGDQGIGFATERDTADALAICRAGYAELSSQLNQILDIEDERHPAPSP